MQIHWKKESVYMRKDFTWENIFLVHLGFVQSLEFLKKSWYLPQNFPDLEKVWKTEIKSWRNCKKSFFESYNKCFTSEIFFVLVKSYSISLVRLQCIMEKALFLHLKVSIDHPFHNLEIVVLEKVLNFRSKNLYEPCTLTWPPFRWSEHQYGCRDFM